MFNKDIVLDEEAFTRAVKDFEALGKQLETLRKEIETMLGLVEKGFNTPMGKKFVNSCKTNLFKPMDDQKLVLAHIAGTLKECKESYATVFAAYEELNRKINQVQNT